jgi:fatty acid elongase 3
MDKFPIPTLDRPFGIELWPIFDKLFEKVVGFPASQFHFLPGYTSLSTVPEVVGAIAAYYLTIWGGHQIMKNQQPLKLNSLFMAHNLILTVVSGGLLVLFIEQLLPIIWRNGVFYSICSPDCWTQKIVTLYYVPTTHSILRLIQLNYLTKYVELIDTVFLFLKKKPLQFLHVYHHGATAVLCFIELIGHTSVVSPLTST